MPELGVEVADRGDGVVVDVGDEPGRQRRSRRPASGRPGRRTPAGTRAPRPPPVSPTARSRRCVADPHTCGSRTHPQVSRSLGAWRWRRRGSRISKRGNLPAICAKTGVPCDGLVKDTLRVVPRWVSALAILLIVPYFVARAYAGQQHRGASFRSRPTAPERIRLLVRTAWIALVVAAAGFAASFFGAGARRPARARRRRRRLRRDRVRRRPDVGRRPARPVTGRRGAHPRAPRRSRKRLGRTRDASASE